MSEKACEYRREVAEAHKRCACDFVVTACGKGNLSYESRPLFRHSHRMRGGALAKLLIGIPVGFLVLLALSFAFFEGRKAYWDWRVKQSCEKEGGIKVYEVVTLDAATYDSMRDKFGAFSVPSKKHALNAPVFETSMQTEIRRWNPAVWRSEYSIYRAADGKLLGTYTSFSRVGGDLLAFHESSFSCARPAINPTDAIIRRAEENRK